MYDLVLHYHITMMFFSASPFSGPHLLPRHFPRCTVLEPAPITGATRRMQAKLWTWRDVLVAENNGKTTRFPGLRVGKLCENSGKTTISRLVRFRMDSADPMLGELLAGKNGETSPLTRIFLWIVHQHLWHISRKLRILLGKSAGMRGKAPIWHDILGTYHQQTCW